MSEGDRNPLLDVDSLIGASQEEAGLADFGEPDVREPLRALVGSLNAEAELTVAGVHGQRASLTRLLVNRLRIRWDLEAHPEIRDEIIVGPVIIVGLRIANAVLQYFQFQDGTRGKPWLLKAPAHLGYMPLVFKDFPNTTVVHCHRDTLSSVASLSGLVAAARRFHSERDEPAEVGRFVCDLWSRQMQGPRARTSDAGAGVDRWSAR